MSQETSLQYTLFNNKKWLLTIGLKNDSSSVFVVSKHTQTKHPKQQLTVSSKKNDCDV